MRKFILLGLFLGSVACSSAGPAAAGTADADWAALQAAGLVPFQPAEGSGWKAAEAEEQRKQVLREQGLAFYEKHPTDPRRWTVLWQMLARPPRFITYGPNYEKDWNDVVIDQAAAAAWQARLGVWAAAQSTATDVPAEAAESFEARAISESIIRLIGPAFQNPAAELPVVDWGPLLGRLTAFDAAHPQSGKAVGLVQTFMMYYERTQPAADSAVVWQRFAASPNPPLAEKARERLRLYALVHQPLELRFTAADGRAVDLAQLRGKVVLIDFWATWCRPCLEEIPHILAAYQKYHGQGFEVVGITLENAGLTPTDTPEQAAAKLTQARQRLTNFATERGLPWPQYFDGKFWQNEIYTAYAINSLPAMLLLDQEGKLVSTDARGAALEREVKRLLKLP